MDRTDLQYDAFKLNGIYLEDLISGYFLSTDTAVNSNKVYFSLTGGKYVKVTPVGTENPTTQGWYEKDGYGYMTHKASGRESLDKQLSTYENGSDGEVLKKSRYPERKIEISYVVRGSSLADMRDKMHKLQTALNVENAEIIFNDDANNYYTATPVMPATVNDAHDAAYGSYELVCHDPFKYSKTLTTVQTTTHTDQIIDESGTTQTVTSTVLTTDNTGGYKTYPTFKVQFATDEDSDGNLGTNADCGYVLFAKGGTDYSVQIGNDQEKDTSSVKVISHFFKLNKRGGFNDDNTVPVGVMGSTYVYNGASAAGNGGLYISSTTNVSKKFHGPLAVYTLGTGYEASGDFSLSWKQIMACYASASSGNKCCGSMYVMLLDSSNNIKFAFGIQKSATNTLYGKQYFYSYNNGWIGPVDYWLGYTGNLGYTKTSGGSERLRSCSYVRTLTYDDNNNVTGANTVLTNGYGTQRTFKETTPCTIKKIAFFLGKYSSNNYFAANRIKSVAFVNGNVDVINTFKSGDYAEIDCGKASITLNDMPSDGLGDVGNNWEDMYLDTGTNTIYVQHSPWVEQGYEPTVTMAYRKRWL